MWSDNESKEDLLGFQYLADAVVSIVKNENLLPATIGVFGDWGGGKSTLIEIVKRQLSSETEKQAGVVVLSFNGWLFEGYEGAKTALMGTILEELQEHETFVNKASGKAKTLLKSLFRRVDWMKATLGAGKLIGAYFAGPHAGPALLFSGATDVEGVAKEAAEKLKEIDPKEVKEYLKEDKDAGINDVGLAGFLGDGSVCWRSLYVLFSGRFTLYFPGLRYGRLSSLRSGPTVVPALREPD